MTHRRLAERRAIRALLMAACLILVAGAAGAQAPEMRAGDAEQAPPVENLLSRIEQLLDEYNALAREEAGLVGEERAVVAIQMQKRLFEFMRAVEDLVAQVTELDPADAEASSHLEQTRQRVGDINARIDRFLDATERELVDLRTERSQADEAEIEELEGRIAGVEQILDESFRFYDSHVGHLETLGLPSDAARSRFARRLALRANEIAGRLEFAAKRLGELRKQSKAKPDDPALASEVRLAIDQRDAVAARLRITCDMMEESGLPTASYRQLLIEATGEITSDVLDFEVARGLLATFRKAVARWLEVGGPALVARLAIFVAILAVFWVLGAAARRAVAALLRRRARSVSELARGILIGIASRVVIGIGLFVALSQVGVNVTALLTGLGIAGFIVGFALQDTLGNFASGAMILMYRPYDVGDVIEAGGISGRVDSMNLVSTTILTYDNQTLVVPNSRIWGDVIRNVTAQKDRRVDLRFGLPHDTDVERAEALFLSVLHEYPHVLADPEPSVKIDRLTDVGIEFIVRPWVRTEHYWDTYWDLQRAIKLRLDRAGIPLAIPRREIRLRTGPEA